MKFIVVLIASISLVETTVADDAAWTFVGGAGNFSMNKQIRMVSERVAVDLRDKRSHFRADFVFRNEGPATSVQMAFPEEAHAYPAKKFGAIHRFTSTVDGRRVRVRRFELGEGPNGSEYRAVWLKRVDFGANQTRRVVVDYWADNGDRGDFVQNQYILKTGATWKGNIGDCLITIDWSHLNNTSLPQFYLSGHRARKNVTPRKAGPSRTELRFHDLEPDFDVRISWAYSFWNFVVNGDLIDGYGLASMLPIVDDPQDPLVILELAPTVFGYPITDIEAPFPPRGTRFKVGRHSVRLLDRKTIEVDGKRKKLARSGPKRDDWQCVYVRDIVKAIGGKYTYNRSLKRVFINTR